MIEEFYMELKAIVVDEQHSIEYCIFITSVRKDHKLGLLNLSAAYSVR